MPNMKVTFDRITVNKDGEALEPGKLYWKLSVNGAKVTERTSSNPLSVSSGSQVDLNASKSIELANNQELVVSGFVAERDGGLSGKDENATFSRSYDRSENWGDGEHDVRVTDRGLDCTVAYIITAE